MNSSKNKAKDRQIGKKPVKKKHLIDPRYKNTIVTALVFLILLVFFIINNTRDVPEKGSYPPNYSGGNSSLTQ